MYVNFDVFDVYWSVEIDIRFFGKLDIVGVGGFVIYCFGVVVFVELVFDVFIVFIICVIDGVEEEEKGSCFSEKVFYDG